MIEVDHAVGVQLLFGFLVNQLVVFEHQVPLLPPFEYRGRVLVKVILDSIDVVVLLLQLVVLLVCLLVFKSDRF